MVNFNPRLFYLLDNNLRYPFDRRLVDLKAGLDAVERETSLDPVGNGTSVPRSSSP
jgi:hypothetical protein